MTCRYIDIRQDHWLEHPPMWGGEAEYGLTAYCFPEYVYSVLNFISNGAGVVEYYLQGAVWGGIMLLTDGPDSAQKLEYVRFANSQRDPQTQERLIPGYPHGFRDSLGLTNNNPSIFAKVYVEGNNVSVVYCTISAVADQKIQVDLDKLGFTGKGMKELAITADAQKIGYQTFTVE